MEFPFGREEHRLEMYAQTYHGKYILTGKTSRNKMRLPYERVISIAQAEAAHIQQDIVSLSPSDRDQLLRALRVRYLVLRPESSRPGITESQVMVAQQTLGPLTQVYSDTELQAYRFDRVAAWLDSEGREVRELVPLFIGLDDQWEPREPDGERFIRWLPPEGAGIWIYSQHPRLVVAEVSLSSLSDPHILECWLNGTRYQRLPISAQEQVRHITTSPLMLPAGTSHLRLHVMGRGVSPSELGLGSDSRPFTFRIHRLTVREVEGFPAR